MAAWDLPSAVTSLRTRLGDNPGDKYEFKVDVLPTPDGLNTKFFGGKTRMVPSTLQIYQAGVDAVPSGQDAVTGTFDLPAPPSGVQLQCSFYWSWFTDAELGDFLGHSAELLRFTGVEDATLPTAVRPITLSFACYYAYMRKAAEFAESVVASTGGFTADQSRTGPNWRQLAKDMWDTAMRELKLYTDNPLAAATPGMRIVAYALRDYLPRS